MCAIELRGRRNASPSTSAMSSGVSEAIDADYGYGAVMQVSDSLPIGVWRGSEQGSASPRSQTIESRTIDALYPRTRDVRV